MNRLMLFVGRGTYLNKNHISQFVRWAPTDQTGAHYEIIVAAPKGQQSVYKVYETEPEYDHISHFLKEETGPVFSHAEFAETGRSW